MWRLVRLDEAQLEQPPMHGWGSYLEQPCNNLQVPWNFAILLLILWFSGTIHTSKHGGIIQCDSLTYTASSAVSTLLVQSVRHLYILSMSRALTKHRSYLSHDSTDPCNGFRKSVLESQKWFWQDSFSSAVVALDRQSASRGHTSVTTAEKRRKEVVKQV